MGDQHGSGARGVGDGLSRQIGRMAADAVRKYPGGTEKAKLAKGHPRFGSEFHALLDRLAAEQTPYLPITPYPVWKILRLGTGLKSAKDFIDAIQQAGGRVSDWTKDIMGKRTFTVANRLIELDLIVVTVAELGFPNGATRKDIYDRALSLGLSLCPSEVGPQLRLQYMDQPKGKWLLIAMERTASPDGDRRVFSVACDAYDRCLYSSYVYPGNNLWSSHCRWVFCRKKKA